jgi:dihydrofolate synthase/folylpolyglutamate synthase
MSDIRLWLDQTKRRGMKLGLKRVHTAHQALIQSYYSTIIHVAGSNGKGTVCALTATHLNRLDQTTVMFTSPHMVRVEERIRINGVPISEQQLDSYLHIIRRTEVLLDIELTFFEVTFLASCLCAHDNCPDVFIVETGLGGRFDATRILPADLCLITSVQLEHREILGDTLAEIAAEKAAIARPNKPIFVREIQDTKARSAIEYEAHHAGQEHLGEIPSPSNVEWIAIDSDSSIKEEAFALVKVALTHLNFNIDFLEESMHALNWPGRMQHIEPMSWGGALFVDAAHNVSGLKRVIPSLTQRMSSQKEWCLVFGCTPQDDLDAFVQPLLDLCMKHSPTNVILTVPQTGRYLGVPITELSELDWASTQAILHTSTPQEAKQILEELQPEYTLVIGSLYLIGELFEALDLFGSKHLELFPPNTQR